MTIDPTRSRGRPGSWQRIWPSPTCGSSTGAFSVDKDAAAAQIAGFATVDDVVGFYERAMPLRLAGLREASGEDMARLVDFFGMMKRPGATLLGLANNHGIHHRGQLAAYLRASGSTVPAIYGDSADEPM